MFGITKETVYPLSGLAAMLVSVPVVEFILFNTDKLPYYSIVLLLSGGFIGGGFSLSFYLMDLFCSKKVNLTKLARVLIMGIIGGGAGLFVGQLLISIILNNNSWMDIYFRVTTELIGYSLSWGVLGLCIGCAEGGGVKSSVVSGIGGFIGGVISGAIFFVLIRFIDDIYLRILGFSLIGIITGYSILLAKKKYSILKLLFLNGSMMGKEIIIIDRTISVGRRENCFINLSDYKGVSRLHALISFEDGNYFIKDSDSTNGTFLNDSKIEHAGLNDGDLIRTGSAKMMVKLRRS